MNTLLSLVVILLLLALLYSLIGILWPVPPWRSRRGWAVTFAGVLAAFVAGTSLLQPPPTFSPPQQALADPRPLPQTGLPPSPAPEFPAVAPAASPLAGSSTAARVSTPPSDAGGETAKAPVDLISRIRASSPHYEDVSVIDRKEGPLKGRVLQMTFYMKTAWSEADLIALPSQQYKRAAELVAQKGAEFSGMEFIIKTDAIDPYGRSEPELVLILSIARTELQKIQWDSISSRGLLNLSAVQLRTLGPSAARAFCADNYKRARTFCDRAVRG